MPTIAPPDLAWGNKYVTESLQFWDPRIILERFPPYWIPNGMYHQVIYDMPWGAETYNMIAEITSGQAFQWNGQATQVPYVQTGLKTMGYGVQMGIAGLRYSWLELEKEKVAAMNPSFPRQSVIPAYKRALKRALDAWVHVTVLLGNPADPEAFGGFMTNMFIQFVYVPKEANPFTGVGSSSNVLADSARLANAGYEFWRRQISTFRDEVFLTMGRNIVMLTDEGIDSSLDRRFGDATGDTVRSSLTQGGNGRAPMLRGIQAVNEFNGDKVSNRGAGNAFFNNVTEIALGKGASVQLANHDFALVYNGNIAETALRHAQGPYYFPVQQDGLEWKQIGIVSTSEMIYPRPLEVKLYAFERGE